MQQKATSADRVKSISAKDLTAKVKDAVEVSLKRHKIAAKFGPISLSPELIGFILRDADLHDKTIGQVSDLAGDVAKQFDSQATIFKFNGGRILLGYIPDFDAFQITE